MSERLTRSKRGRETKKEGTDLAGLEVCGGADLTADLEVAHGGLYLIPAFQSVLIYILIHIYI